jgi:DNA-binding MarR family transcriptional regulator
MNLGRLHRIGRHLQEVAVQAMHDHGDRELNRAQRVVQADVYAHPGSSVGEITERTGFTQGHVSTCVARLRELGRLTTQADPLERRRTVVQLTPEATRVIDKRVMRDAEDLLAEILDQPSPAHLRQVISLLDELDSRLHQHTADSHRTRRRSE